MKPSNQAINARLKEVCGVTPLRAREVRQFLREGGIYFVKRYDVLGSRYSCGNEVRPEERDSAAELIKECHARSNATP